jgi:Amt family ammonium transporter
MAIGTWLPATLAYLMPIGLFLMGWGGFESGRARRAATLGGLALALTTVGYYCVGFGLHLGGAHVMAPGLTGLEGLRRSWGPSREWVLLGTTGFFLSGDAATPAALGLFFIYLPLAAAAVLLPVLSLSAHARGWQAVAGGGLMACVVFPLVACWVWGGGWLSQLGSSLDLGHGVVDYAGSAVVFMLGGSFSLGGLVGLGRRLPALEPDAPDEMPPVHLPLIANLGSLLFLVGWLGWSLSTPFHVAGAELNLPLIAVNGLLAVAGATLASQAYSWITSGRADALMAARGAATGLVAVSAAAPFIPSWSALLIGLVAGVLFPLGTYVSLRLARLPDASGAIPMGLIGGGLGTLMVALFADGRWGLGWNRLVLDESRLRAGQGVTGFFPAGGLGFVANGRGQTLAQLAGAGVVALVGAGAGYLLFLLLTASSRVRTRPSAGTQPPAREPSKPSESA